MIEHDINEFGFAIIENVVEATVIETVCQQLQNIEAGEAVRRKESVFGIRNVFDVAPETRPLCFHPQIRRIAESVLGDDCFAIRATLFNKADGANWALGWHRDRFIAVADHVPNAEGFHAWSQKAGVWHVQPPLDVMKSMLAIRLHLDDCPAENGALRVIPRTHNPDTEVDRTSAVTCAVGKGGVLAMRPLLMHASSAARQPAQRRVLHIEFAAAHLPGDVEWYDRIKTQA